MATLSASRRRLLMSAPLSGLALLVVLTLPASPAAAATGAGSAAAATVQQPQDVAAQDYGQELSARVWLDRGQEPLLDRGDRVRIYYRTSADAYVAIFKIDTNGTTQLVFPRSPDESHWVRGGRDYRLLFPRSQYWYVDDDPGMGYYFILASPEPFDFSYFDYSYYDRGWDLTRVGRTVYSDPYVAMDDYVATLIPDWEYVPYSLDFVSYHVGQERYDYPRFLCYDCHGFRSYQAWNPYHYYCSTFRVVIYNDPYYYPSYRYRGSRVVYARPPRPREPRFVFKERADGEAGAPQVASRPGSPVADRPGVGGDAAPRRSTPGVGSGGERRAVPGAVGGSAGERRPGVPTRAGGQEPRGGRDGAVGSPGSRPTSGLGRTDGERRMIPVVPREGGEGSPARTRPVLERRPPAGGSGGATPSRPSSRVLPRTGGGERGEGAGRSGPPARAGSGSGASTGGGPAVRVIPRRGGSTGGGSARPPVRVRPRTGGSSTGGGSARPTTRPSTTRSGSSGTTRPPARARTGGSRGSGGSAAPTRSRSSGSAVPTRSRSGGSATPTRSRSGGSAVPTRSRTGGSASSGRSSSGGSAASSRTRSRTGGSASRGGSPPVRARGGGGSDAGDGVI